MTRCVPGPSFCPSAHCCTELHSPTRDRLPEQAEVRVCARARACMHTQLCLPARRGPCGAAIYKQKSAAQRPGNHQRQADNTFSSSATSGADREGTMGVSEESRPDPFAFKLREP